MNDPRIIPASDASIAKAAASLQQGHLVAFPTETVYGLGGDATDDDAIAAIFATKNRPDFNPLIVHVADLETAESIVSFTPTAHKLADAFWPGALTMVLPRLENSNISLLVSAGLDTVAVRVPDHPVAHSLLSQSHLAIAAPSANRSSEISPTMAVHVAASLTSKQPEPHYIIDGGACPVGLESTVSDLSTDTPTLLRPGGVTHDQIETVIGPISRAEPDQPDQPRSPGMLSRHYAPKVPLTLNATEAQSGEVLIGFGPSAPVRCRNLSPSGDLQEAAANLFALMREVDAEEPTGIAIMPLPETGLGLAINDRLRRAATPAE